MAITRKRKLRAGLTVWQGQRRPRIRAGELRRGLGTQVLVVGAGISGALIADALTTPGLDVLIVDRRGSLAGSTPASTALLQYEIDTPLHVLARRIGRDRAVRGCWRRWRSATFASRRAASPPSLQTGAACMPKRSCSLPATRCSRAYRSRATPSPRPGRSRRDALLPTKTARIEAKLQRLLPNVDPRADYAWCGSFGASRTGTPTIGPVPGMPGCFAAMGYGGNGITFSMMAAQLLRGLITGVGDPDTDLVSFSRKC